MAQVSTYLNFANSTEAAFNFYKTVFGADFVGGISRFGEAPPEPGQPELSDADKQLVMNVQLPILGGHMLMGSDAPESMGMTVKPGNNVYVCLHPDSREEADRLFAALSDGGTVEMAMMDMFWGDYYGSLADKFGIQWMISHTPKA